MISLITAWMCKTVMAQIVSLENEWTTAVERVLSSGGKSRRGVDGGLCARGFLC